MSSYGKFNLKYCNPQDPQIRLAIAANFTPTEKSNLKFLGFRTQGLEMASTKKRLKVPSVVKNFFINAVHQCFIHVHQYHFNSRSKHRKTGTCQRANDILPSFSWFFGVLGCRWFCKYPDKKQSTCATGWNFNGGKAMFQTLGRVCLNKDASCKSQRGFSLYTS